MKPEQIMHLVAAFGGFCEKAVVYQVLQEVFGIDGVGVQQGCGGVSIGVGPRDEAEAAVQQPLVSAEASVGQVEHSGQLPVTIGEPRQIRPTPGAACPPGVGVHVILPEPHLVPDPRARQGR
ncbi:hypothetical protein OHA02_52010 [Streptomyces phaeochromogenes]|nr:hypothetical protein [Streptomyces phaeochromogenes]